MKYKRFEELPVWQAAIKFAVGVYALTERDNFRGKWSLKDQIERAAVSISNNIAEGFERGTTQEMLTFIYIARGSSGETRSMLCLFEQMENFDGLKSEICNLKSQAEGISRQLGAWASSLRSSEITGTRYLSEKTQQMSKAKREREEFLAELRRAQEEAQAKRLRELESSDGGE